MVDCTHTWKVKDVKAASNSNLVQLTRSSSQHFILFIGGVNFRLSLVTYLLEGDREIDCLLKLSHLQQLLNCRDLSIYSIQTIKKITEIRVLLNGNIN